MCIYLVAYVHNKADLRGTIFVVQCTLLKSLAEVASGTWDTEYWSLGVPNTEGES